MSGPVDILDAGAGSSRSRTDVPTRRLTVRQRRQIALITLAAILVFSFLRWLPTGTNLGHMDFRVDGKKAIDFCDPLNPQFIPVVAVPSPVSLTLAHETATPGRQVVATATLRTASGKPIAPPDLLVTHTERLHLLIADPSLTDYQHVHPTPGRTAGDWEFRFTPRRAGNYRVFADFTPAATGRGLYASADLPVGGGEVKEHGAGSREQGADMREQGKRSREQGGEEREQGAGSREQGKRSREQGAGGRDQALEHEGYVYRLEAAPAPIRARQPADLRFTVTQRGGGPVPMQPVMGAYAHLVAFDEGRTGFAHLHPTQTDVSQPPNAITPALDFKITIPRAGRYVIWAQVNLGGRDVFVPFWFEVEE